MNSYRIEPIGARTIDKAYPLASIAARALQRPEWRQFCESQESSRAQVSNEDGEHVVVALNARAHVKGLCVYAIRNHSTYGRVLDVPFFLAASAADGEGVATALVDFLRAECDKWACSGIRFWTADAENWSRRSNPDYVARSDHGCFLPALTNGAELEKSLCAHVIEGGAAIDQLSR